MDTAKSYLHLWEESEPTAQPRPPPNSIPPHTTTTVVYEPVDDGWHGTVRELANAVERAVIRRVLETNNWNLSKAAKALGIARGTLYGKIKSHGIEKPS